jgi:hypothetical protein
VKRHREARRAGSSLLEILIATTLLALVMGTVWLLLSSSSNAYRTRTDAAELEAKARITMKEITGRLRKSSPTTVTVNGARIDFQRSLGIQNEVVVWGPTERIEFQYSATDPNDGVDNDRNGVVDDGRVVWIENPGLANERRQTLARRVREWAEGETPANGIDDNANGLIDEGGLSFDLDVNRVTVRMSLERSSRDGQPLVRSVQSSAAFRNP